MRPPPTSSKSRTRLVLREWQLWHTFSSYFMEAMPPIEMVAENLVQWGLAECAVTSEGSAWWSNDDLSVPPMRTDRRQRPLGHGTIRIEPTHDRRTAQVHFPPGVRGYPAQALMDWSWARYSELLLFGGGPLPPRYVWAQIGACTFISPGARRRKLIVYPQIKIFETGVVLVHFRMFSPERPIDVKEYVNEYVNASLSEFRWVWVPPGVAAWAPMAIPEANIFRWYRRPWTAFTQRYHQRFLADHVELVEMGDFSFRQVSLGLAQDHALAEDMVKKAMPEIQRATRDAMRTQAAAHGIHLSEDLELLAVDPDVDLEGTVGTASGASSIVDTGPADDYERPAEVTESPRRTLDVEQLEKDVERATITTARRLSQAVSEEAIRAPRRDPETFQTLALTLMRVAGFVAGTHKRGPRHGPIFVVAGPGHTNDMGNHWTGRPNSHLFRFSQQANSASDNLARYDAELGEIIGRAAVRNPDLSRRWLPLTSRAFDDYSAHLAPSGTLWVHGRESLERAEAAHAQINRAVLVHEQQVKVELLEYGYSLHRRIADRVLSRTRDDARSADILLEAQRDLADFEWAVQDTGHFGEVRAQLEAGWIAFGVPKLRERIAEGLRVRQEATTYRKGITTGRWSAFLALVAGMLAVPPLVDIVVKPAWRLARLPRPASDDAFALLLAGVSMLVVGSVLIGGYAWSRGVHRSKT